MDDRERDVCQAALKAWGVQKQLDMMVEEMAELTQAIMKYKRANGKKGLIDVMKEGVDVDIMLMQIQLLFPPEHWLSEKLWKEDRLRQKLRDQGVSV